MLTRYWIEFVPSEDPSPLHLGCGITAYSIEDALAFLQTEVFAVCGPREVRSITPNIDVRLLDPGHVRPNMRVPVVRGVWFPML